jgi:glycosyltransferase involved in cell wall biosynthesis
MNKKLKILHVGKYYYPYRGGIESVVKDICTGLNEKGHEVEVLCSHTKPWGQKDNIDGIEVTRVSRFGVLLGQCLVPTLFFWLLKKSKKADIVHIHTPNPLVEFFSLWIPKNTPLIVTYHSDVIRQKSLWALYRPLLRRLLNRAEKIYVATENHITHSMILPEFKEKCHVIPFGIKTEQYKESDAVLKKGINFREKYGSYILFVGRLVSYKGLDVLIKAAEKFSYPVVIVGEGPERRNLEQMVAEKGLKDQFHFLGKVEGEDSLTGLYYGCEVFVLPSKSSNENFGVVQIEAMACSRAVVTTELPSGVSAVGEKGKTCLQVKPGDPETLYMAITTLMENPELRKRMGRLGKARYHKLYTFKKMVEGHLQSYQDILEPDQNEDREKSDKKVA